MDLEHDQKCLLTLCHGVVREIIKFESDKRKSIIWKGVETINNTHVVPRHQQENEDKEEDEKVEKVEKEVEVEVEVEMPVRDGEKEVVLPIKQAIIPRIVVWDDKSLEKPILSRTQRKKRRVKEKLQKEKQIAREYRRQQRAAILMKKQDKLLFQHPEDILHHLSSISVCSLCTTIKNEC